MTPTVCSLSCTSTERAQRSVVRGPAQPLDVGAPLLRLDAPLHGTATRPGRSSRRSRRPEGVGHDLDQPGARSFPVAQLSAVLGRRDRQRSVDDTTAQTFEDSFSLDRRQNRGACDIPDELRARVGGVHALSPGTGRSREPPRQLRLRDRESRVDPESGTVSSRHGPIILSCSEHVPRRTDGP